MNICALVEGAAGGTGRLRFLPANDEYPVGAAWAASEAASRWMDRRVGGGGSIAAVMHPELGALAAMLGAWRAGITFVSLPLPSRGVDPLAYASQLAAMCRAADCDSILLTAGHAALLPEDLGLSAVVFDEVLTSPGSGAVDRPGGRFVQFSSGSTGDPKGIVLSLDAIAANVTAILQVLDIRPGDHCVSWLPLSHDMGLIGMTLAGLVGCSPDRSNGSLTLITPEHFLRSPGSWLRACSDLGGTITGAPNFALDLVARLDREAPVDLSTLRVCIVGGERVRGDTLRRFDATFGPRGLSAHALCPAYGLAETTLAVSMVRPDVAWTSAVIDRNALASGEWTELEGGAISPSPNLHQTEPGSAIEGFEVVSNGPTLSGMQVRPVSDHRDAIGELEVSGPSLFDGYLGQPPQFVDGTWFHTADLGRVGETGSVYVLGRTDDVIVVAGRKLYATDLEAAAADPAVRPGNVVAVPTGHGGYAILAEPARHATTKDLTEACGRIRSRQVGLIGAGPAWVQFVQPGSIMKTPSGKVRRAAVAAAVASGAFEVLAVRSFGRR